MLDIHTHYDVEVLVGPALTESLRHGVTTVMLGSCSLSTVHVGGVGRRRHLRTRRGDPPRTCDRRGRRAQDLDQLRGVHRGAGGASARPQRGGVHRALGYARRDHGTGPRDPEAAAADQKRTGARWRSGSTRRCAPGSSECPLSNCFSTSSTAKSAGPARCLRPTPSRENCVASSPSCAGRAGSCSPDPTSRTR